MLRVAQLVAAALALALALVLGLAGRTSAAPPNSGPGGPILVITDSSNPFTQYYAEILRAEGLNEFALADISTVTPSTLAGHDVAILGDLTPTDGQVTTLSNWVTGGGNLIAMRPDQRLGSLLGLSPAGGTPLSNAYLKVDTTKAPGAGIVGETIQYHGAADLWTLSGASSVAALHPSALADPSSPAVTVRNVGTNGGQAAAFTFDLARSVVTTRQGNPAWAGQERDGTAPVRANDMFFGGGAEPDWIDLSKVAIPQADEQQRLLANLIGDVTSDRKPLPRFWYLPRDEKAAVVMTGDDHSGGGTAGRFDSFVAASPPGCDVAANVAAWQCIRGTSYVYPDTVVTGEGASQYDAAGFEIALHVNTNCADFTPATLGPIFSEQLALWRTAFSTLPRPVTNRTHCVVWSDWASQPKTELANGIRFDTNYYYWPGSWVGNRPGFFTGSGMPMRFGDVDGSMIDVYQAATQMTDESGQTYPSTVDALLGRATGPDGYYGVFTANMHTDSAASPGADEIVASAQRHGVPVVSSKQMLEWIDGRNDSSFGSIAWSPNALSFTVSAGAGANGLRGMLPLTANGSAITSITRNGAAVAFTPQRIKGVDYAFFDAVNGSYVARYGTTPDPTPTPTPGTTGTPGTPAGPAAPGTGSSSPVAGGSKSKSTAGCLTLTSSAKRVAKGRLTRLTATVRRNGRPAAGVRVVLNGAGVRALSRRTNSKGQARFAVRPRRTGSLRLRAVGQRPSCRPAKANVVVARKG